MQAKITKVKYENQIEMARQKQEQEQNFDESLEGFKSQATQDAKKNIQEIEKWIHLNNEQLN